ncbi:MAG: LolA family protein [Chitinophagaceae bacterium]
MKKIYLLALTFISLNFINAQTDANAKKILDNLKTKLKSASGISANFSLKSITSKGKPNGTKNGTIAAKGQKYVLKQGSTEIICDGAKIYNYDGKKTITISGVEESNQTLSPQNLLSNFSDKDFTYKLISNKGNVAEIELYPTDKRKNFVKVNIYIDNTKNVITKAKVLDKSQNIVEFSMNNVNTSAKLNDNLFVFNKAKYPKDVEILD